MLQAELEEANRIRGIQATERDTHAIQRQWFQQNPIQEVVNILADALGNNLESVVDPGQDGQNGPADEEEEPFAEP